MFARQITQVAGCNSECLRLVKTKYSMKIFRILAVVALMAVAVVGCKKNKGDNGPVNGNSVALELVAKQWKLQSVNGVDAEFVVYLDLKNDMSFEMFQQLYTLEYEAYIGTYSLKGDVLKGSYITGQNWKSEYRIVSVSDSALELESIEENSITMVYAATTIPADIATTRSHSSGVEPLL